MKKSSVCLVVLAILSACSSSPGNKDAGTSIDAGMSMPGNDAGPMDAGYADAGPMDAGVPDAICTNPMANVSQSCVTCVNDLSSSNTCVQTFVSQCQSDSNCLSFGRCIDDCANGDAGTPASDQGCLAQAGDGGTNACEGCCANALPTGSNDYTNYLVEDCVCTPGAPCETACQ